MSPKSSFLTSRFVSVVMELDWKEVDFEEEEDGKLKFSDEEGEPLLLPFKFFEG